jgi:hypothetical protein
MLSALRTHVPAAWFHVLVQRPPPDARAAARGPAAVDHYDFNDEFSGHYLGDHDNIKPDHTTLFVSDRAGRNARKRLSAS